MADTGITVDQLKARLTQVQAAITAILTTGASYQRPGLSLTHAHLPDLRSERQYLIRQITRQDTGAISVSEVSNGESTSGFDNDCNSNH